MTSRQKEMRWGPLSRLFSRALHTYFRLSRGLTLGVRAIVRNEDGEFLLVRHTYTPGWHFPGGGVEKGETAKNALGRELRQETGLVLTGEPILHGVFFNHDMNQRDHVLAYLCEVEPGQLKKNKGVEIAEIGFFGVEDFPQGVDPGTMRRIREITEDVVLESTW